MRRSSFFRDLTRALSWHRRKLAVVAAVAAVLTGITAATPAATPTTIVVVTTAALSGGESIGPGDVASRPLPQDAIPDQAVTDPQSVIGRTLVAPLPIGSVLTGLSVLSGRTVADPGQVLAPIRIDDASVVALLQVGERIDVVSADPQSGKSAVIARNVRVVTLPQQPGSSTLGVASGGADTGSGQLVLLAVDEAEAAALIRAGGNQIGVILH